MFLGSVFNNGLAFQQNAGHHNIGRCANGRHIQANTVAGQAILAGGQCHVLFRFFHASAQGLEALDMLVNGAGSKAAAAGQGHMAITKATQQGAHQIIAGTHLLDQGSLRLRGMDAAGIDDDHIGFRLSHFRAQSPQNGNQNTDIGDIRHIFNSANAIYQQRSGQNGNSGIFGAANGDRAMKLVAANDLISCQGLHTPCKFKF